jgi:hypothetical protein
MGGGGGGGSDAMLILDDAQYHPVAFSNMQPSRSRPNLQRTRGEGVTRRRRLEMDNPKLTLRLGWALHRSLSMAFLKRTKPDWLS